MLSLQSNEMAIKTNMLLSLFLKLQVFMAIVSELGKMPMCIVFFSLYYLNPIKKNENRLVQTQITFEHTINVTSRFNCS